MNDGQVLTEWSKAGDADIATVVVDRPAKLNALHMDLSKELAASFVALRDTHARAVVLTGAGDKAFIGGAGPLFADYIVFGAFQWARVVCPHDFLEQGDPVTDWFARCLDLHGGLGREVPACG